MKRSSIVLVAILSILVSFIFISLLAGKLYKQKEHAAKYIMEDLLSYKEAQFVVYPVANYYIRKTLYTIFWMMLNNNKTYPEEEIIAPFFLDPESQNNKFRQELSSQDVEALLNSLYIKNDREWHYLFARPFIPLNNKTTWFFQKLEYYYSDILEDLKSFVDDEYRKVDSKRLSIKNYNDSIKILYNHNFYVSGYINHSVTMINNYSVWPDVLWYDIELSEPYCNASKILDIYKEFKNPDLFVATLKKYKEYLYPNKQTGNIHFKKYFDYYSPIYDAYGINSSRTLLATALINCPMFGGVFNGTTCESPTTRKGNTYYYECIKDKNIEDSPPEEIEYTYEYLYFNREDNSTVYTTYLPDVEGFSTLASNLSNIDPFLSKRAIKNIIFHNRIFYFNKVVCQVGYYMRSVIYDSCSAAASFCSSMDGYYWICVSVIAFCADYDSEGNCVDIDCEVTYKRRSRSVSTSEDYFKMVLFGCTSI